MDLVIQEVAYITGTLFSPWMSPLSTKLWDWGEGANDLSDYLYQYNGGGC
jgi:hypothetical protein